MTNMQLLQLCFHFNFVFSADLHIHGSAESIWKIKADFHRVTIHFITVIIIGQVHQIGIIRKKKEKKNFFL